MTFPTRRPRFLEEMDGPAPAKFAFTRIGESRPISAPIEREATAIHTLQEDAGTTPLSNSESEATSQPEAGFVLDAVAMESEELPEGKPAPVLGTGETVERVDETEPELAHTTEEQSQPSTSSLPDEAPYMGMDHRILAAIEALRLRGERLAEEARADAVEIGFMVAKKILEHEISTGPKALFDLVRSAIRKAGESRKFILRLHPQDCVMIEHSLREHPQSLTLAQIECISDSTLSQGDCLVEGDLGRVDGRLVSRLAELAKCIEQALREDAP